MGILKAMPTWLGGSVGLNCFDVRLAPRIVAPGDHIKPSRRDRVAARHFALLH